MAGLCYDAQVVLYNATGGTIGNPKILYGTLLPVCRVDLTQGANIASTGLENANACTLRVYDADLPAPYAPPAIWYELDEKTECITFDAASFFIVTSKADIGADADVPLGAVEDSSYDGGLMAYLRQTYGHVYRVMQADHYSLIPHWEVGAS